MLARAIPRAPGATDMNRKRVDSALKKLRAACRGLPEANEVAPWGNPTFRAGKKAFAVLEEWAGDLCLALKIGLDRRDELLCDSRFCETPYCGHQGWVT